MRSVDRAGVDDCIFIDDRGTISDAYQFKGFEDFDLSSSHVEQCRHSITSLLKSRFAVKRYFLVVNRIVRGNIRTDIQQALEEVVRMGKAESCELLDVEAFLEAAFTEARRQLVNLLNESAAHLQKLHAERMNEEFYVEDVPFELNARPGMLSNPLQVIMGEIDALYKDPSNKRCWGFITGKFGFGKTSLALNLANSLNSRGFRSIYMPVAQFEAHALSEHKLMWALLQFVQDGSTDRTSLRDQIMHAVFKEILKSDKRCVVIIDGIDEHPICWRENGLRNLFDVFKTFSAFCIFTTREEFYSERAGSFDAALTKAPKHRVFVHMRSWPDELILHFTTQSRERLCAELPRKHLDHFADAVRSGQYTQLFGDIPKRPLFLNMLVQKIADDGVHAINLSDLYLDMFIKKFSRDRETSAPRPVVARPLNVSEDRSFVCAELLKIMTHAAGLMLHITANHVEILPTIPSSKLMKSLRTIGIGLDLSSILMHSVLVPAGRRAPAEEGGDLQLEFAHKSYQEFFTARYFSERRNVTDGHEAVPATFIGGSISRFSRASSDN